MRKSVLLSDCREREGERKAKSHDQYDDQRGDIMLSECITCVEYDDDVDI